MLYMVDAWFERSNPYLRIIDNDTGISVLNWQGDTLKKKFQDGYLSIEDFSVNPTNELVAELFLLDGLD